MASGLSSFLGGFAGSAIGGATVQLFLDDSRYNAGLAQAEGKTVASTSAMGGTMSKFQAVGVAAFAGVATAALVGAAKAVEAASNQEEALNKVRVVFGESAGEVEKFAESAATSLGMSETAALSAAGTFGNFFTAAGLTSSAVTDMSQSVVTLAADLASFNNIDPTEALEKLRAGLAGEAEPLRTVGVFLSEARVATEAYSSGIAQAGEDLTDAQKIQARYNLILQDTTLAQGDFARTSDSLANQQRILAATMEDLSAKAGKVLLPAVQGVASLLLTLAPLLEIAANNASLLLKVLLAYAGLRFLPALLAAINRGLVALNLQRVAGGLSGASLGAQRVVSSFSTMAPLVGILAIAMEGLALRAKNAADNLAEVGDKAAYVITDFAKSDALINFAASFSLLRDEARRYGNEQAFLVAIQSEARAQFESGALTVEQYRKVLESTGKTLPEINRKVAEVADASDTLRVHFSKAGKEVANFAHKTGAELKDFREATKDEFRVSGESVIGFKRKFEGSVESFLTGLNHMAQLAKDRLRDLRELNTIHIGDSIKEFLLTQGPDAIHQFVEANKKGRDAAVEHIGSIITTERKLGGEVDTATEKTNNLKGAMDSLGRKKANPTVTFQYRFTDEDGALKTFMGLQGATG